MITKEEAIDAIVQSNFDSQIFLTTSDRDAWLVKLGYELRQDEDGLTKLADITEDIADRFYCIIHGRSDSSECVEC
jgi:hypothetical protein